MDLALNNLQRLICNKTQTINQPQILNNTIPGYQTYLVQEEIQIGSVAFLPGQCTSPQLHPCHRLFDQDGHQDSSSASL